MKEVLWISFVCLFYYLVVSRDEAGTDAELDSPVVCQPAVS